VLTDVDARTLIASALGDAHGSVDTERAVTELTDSCSGFPLALGLIAARLRYAPALLHDVVADLRELGLDALDSEDPAASLPTVLSWSLRHLTDQHRTVFGLLGIAPGPDITLPAVASLAGLPQAGARQALAALEEASLIERRPGGRYVMHDLVRDYATDTARTALPQNVRKAALTRVMDFHLHTAFAADRLLASYRPLVHPNSPVSGVRPLQLSNIRGALAWLEAEYANIMETQRIASDLGRHDLVWHLAWGMDTFHRRRWHRRDAVAAWQAALDATVHLPDPTARTRAYRLLGYACSRLGQHEDATEHLNQAVELAVFHGNPSEQAHSERLLAVAWRRRGDDQQAMTHAQRALNLFQTLDLPRHEAEALNQVGWYAARAGEFGTAYDYCRTALTLHRHHHNPDGEATTLDSLGFIACRTGDHQGALDFYHEALSLRRYLGNVYRVADTLEDMGSAHVSLERPRHAYDVWQEALGLYQEQGRYSDAERVQRQLDELDNPSGTGNEPDDR
jgi:tetratricopeptide (TPR) repeat protein